MFTFFFRLSATITTTIVGPRSNKVEIQREEHERGEKSRERGQIGHNRAMPPNPGSHPRALPGSDTTRSRHVRVRFRKGVERGKRRVPEMRTLDGLERPAIGGPLPAGQATLGPAFGQEGPPASRVQTSMGWEAEGWQPASGLFFRAPSPLAPRSPLPGPKRPRGETETTRLPQPSYDGARRRVSASSPRGKRPATPSSSGGPPESTTFLENPSPPPPRPGPLQGFGGGGKGASGPRDPPPPPRPGPDALPLPGFGFTPRVGGGAPARTRTQARGTPPAGARCPARWGLPG